MGRPQKYHNDTVLILSGRNATTRLQKCSDRRALIDAIIDAGGRMTLGRANEHFGMDMRRAAISLVYSGWLVASDSEGTEGLDEDCDNFPKGWEEQ